MQLHSSHTGCWYMVLLNSFYPTTEKTFTRRFFARMQFIMGVVNLFTVAFHSQTNGQVERLSRTIFAGIRHYELKEPKDRDLFTELLIFGYNTQVHWTTGCTHLELDLSRPPAFLPLAKTLVHYPKQSSSNTYCVRRNDSRTSGLIPKYN